jgi:hypothetical protein
MAWSPFDYISFVNRKVSIWLHLSQWCITAPNFKWQKRDLEGGCMHSTRNWENRYACTPPPPDPVLPEAENPQQSSALSCVSCMKKCIPINRLYDLFLFFARVWFPTFPSPSRRGKPAQTVQSLLAGYASGLKITWTSGLAQLFLYILKTRFFVFPSHGWKRSQGNVTTTGRIQFESLTELVWEPPNTQWSYSIILSACKNREEEYSWQTTRLYALISFPCWWEHTNAIWNAVTSATLLSLDERELDERERCGWIFIQLSPDPPRMERVSQILEIVRKHMFPKSFSKSFEGPVLNCRAKPSQMSLDPF